MAIMLDNTDCSHISGFNYQPSYGSTGLEIWLTKFDVSKIRTELGRGKKYFPAMNAVRLWLSFDAYVRDPCQFLENFDVALDICEEYDLLVMPCLFNNWHSVPDLGGISLEQVKYWHSSGLPEVNYFMKYVEDVVGQHAEDDRIFLWDICNEPFNSGRPEEYIPWLEDSYALCKKLGAKAPLTVGAGGIGHLKLVDHICDVLTPHLYNHQYDAQWFSNMLEEAVAFANQTGKPMLAGETGWGHLEDNIRFATLTAELESLTNHKIGFMIHLLHHSLIADGHRKEFGPVSHVGFMGCIEADGSIRKGYDQINRFFG